MISSPVLCFWRELEVRRDTLLLRSLDWFPLLLRWLA
jgi:hypothetical protein